MRPAWEARPFEDAPVPSGLPERDEIAAYHLIDEMRLVGGLVERAIFTATERNRIADRAARLVSAARANRHKHGGVDAFMHEYGLTSEEGIILMCLAEALLRIPDKDTADALIAEKIGGGRWEKHLGHSDSLFVNASTFGLMITGRVVRLGEAKGAGPAAVLEASGGAVRRALHPPGAAPGHEGPGRQLRARDHHRGGAGARRNRSKPRAIAFPTTCWASGPKGTAMPTAISAAT